MTQSAFDVVALGNAIVDVLATVDPAFVEAESRLNGMVPGGMTLIDETRAIELYAKMPPAMETSGGSAGNTIAGLASFGGKGGFIAKVAQDQLGEVFAHDLRSMGVTFQTQPIVVGAKTGRCLILVTPDGQRTMNTYLGAGSLLSPDDVDDALISSASITYLEGYLFDPAHAKEAFRCASEIAHAAGRKIAFTLSDSFCVERHRDDMLNFVENEADIVFANEAEIMSLYQVRNFDDAVNAVRGKCGVAVLTRSEKGSVIVTGDETIPVKASTIDKVIDTTGAGDQYAAGFLYGYTHGMKLVECGRLGSLAAAEVISHMGPRPALKYADFLKKAA